MKASARLLDFGGESDRALICNVQPTTAGMLYEADEAAGWPSSSTKVEAWGRDLKQGMFCEN